MNCQNLASSVYKLIEVELLEIQSWRFKLLLQALFYDPAHPRVSIKTISVNNVLKALRYRQH